MNKKSVYITTTLPYVNNDPHVGFAMEVIRADVLARYHALIGNDVFFNTGTDEHGQKLLNDAIKAGKDVKEYVDYYAEQFRGLAKILGLTASVHFIRTTDEHHVKAAQEFWKICDKKGYIYKKNYERKYCVGCELEKNESELVNGRCPIHPNKELEIINEENYFFKFSEFTQPLLDYYEKNPEFVKPDFRFKEMKNFVENGLQDFSISRLASKMSWGVPVPGDEEHVMYVWFDALVNYISTLGWPDENGDFKKFWEDGYTIQICGKDNLRQQSSMWQGMLMAAGIKNTDRVIINGFLNGPDGQKMSKSLGNVINPYDVVKELGTDAIRFYLINNVMPFDDSPISLSMMRDSYTANLVNGLGNLTNRILKMAISYEVSTEVPDREEIWSNKEFAGEVFHEAFKNFEMNKALNYIMDSVREMDAFITREEPFKKIKVDEEGAKADVARLLSDLWRVGVLIEPFMPGASLKIIEAITEMKMPEVPIFPRLP